MGQGSEKIYDREMSLEVDISSFSKLFDEVSKDLISSENLSTNIHLS